MVTCGNHEQSPGKLTWEHTTKQGGGCFDFSQLPLSFSLDHTFQCQECGGPGLQSADFCRAGSCVPSRRLEKSCRSWRKISLWGEFMTIYYWKIIVLQILDSLQHTENSSLVSRYSYLKHERIVPKNFPSSWLTKCPNVSHRPTFGDIISNRYLVWWFSISPRRDIYQPKFLTLKTMYYPQFPPFSPPGHKASCGNTRPASSTKADRRTKRALKSTSKVK